MLRFIVHNLAMKQGRGDQKRFDQTKQAGLLMENIFSACFLNKRQKLFRKVNYGEPIEITSVVEKIELFCA